MESIIISLIIYCDIQYASSLIFKLSLNVLI